MKFKTIRDKNGNPVAIQMSYSDWVDLKIKYNIEPDSSEATGLDWFAKRESANSILNGLVAYYGREIIKEQSSISPDQNKISGLESKAREIMKVLSSPGTFESIENMDQIINTYGPIVKAINQAARIN